jgi:hypothetical protein
MNEKSMWLLVKLTVTKHTTEPGGHMDSRIVAAFCLSDDILKALYHREDRQSWIGDAEIMKIYCANGF